MKSSSACYEYHRTLALVHSIGAKGGKLESVRPLLGYIARSYEVDKVWEKQRDAMIKALDERRAEQRAASNATHTSSPSDNICKGAEDFDQYIRGTERVEDSSGNVSEQSSLYSYHWTDGFGNYVHSNDSSFDPNHHSNVPYEKLTPVK